MIVLARRQIGQILNGKAVVTCKKSNVPQLTVTLRSLFSLASDSPPRSRWAFRGTNPVASAAVSLGGLQCVTDAEGKAYFDVAALAAGPLPLEVTPPPGQATSAAAGPDLEKNTAQSAMPESLFRPFTGTLQVKSRQFVVPKTAADPKHALQRGILHARLYTWDAKDVTIDYRPDFLRAANSTVRKKSQVRWVVLHRTAADTSDIGPALNTFFNGNGGTSAHYVVDRDGFVVKMVQETSYSWHAGCSLWKGTRDLNPATVGIEIVAAADKNEDQTRSVEVFTDDQYRAIIDLVGALRGAHGLSRHAVVGHSDVNTKANAAGDCVGFSLGGDRVTCPGKEMDWPRLARSSIGTRADGGTGLAAKVATKYHGYFSKTKEGGARPRLLRGDRDDPKAPVYGGKARTDMAGTALVETLRGDLLTIGYSVSDSFFPGKNDGGYRNGQLLAGPYEEATQEALKCFQRHFMQRGGSAVSWYFEEDIAMTLEAVLQDLQTG